MFKAKNLTLNKMYSNGRRTKIMFGLKKPYPKFRKVKMIILLFDYYMRKYPFVRIDCLSDSASLNKDIDESTYAEYVYEIDNPGGSGNIIFNSQNINDIFDWNMLGKGYVPDGYKMKNNVRWNANELYRKHYLQFILMHEFAHAIETQCKIYEDKEIRRIFGSCAEKELYENDVSEFIVSCFLTSEIASGDEIANHVRQIIDAKVQAIGDR